MPVRLGAPRSRQTASEDLADRAAIVSRCQLDSCVGGADTAETLGDPDELWWHLVAPHPQATPGPQPRMREMRGADPDLRQPEGNGCLGVQ